MDTHFSSPFLSRISQVIQVIKDLLCAGFVMLILVSWQSPLPKRQPGRMGADVYTQYDKFNSLFLDSTKYIYRNHLDAPHAVDRWNGAAAIWCQAIFFDMSIEAYLCAKNDGDKRLMKRYKTNARRLFEGNVKQYVGFNFDDANTNTGWFVYDDIMWWTIALARAYMVMGDREYLQLSERSFERVWNGSKVVGDDGSYADPKRGLGGGMFWEWQPIDSPAPHRPGDFRSACINFPTVIASALLYQCTRKHHYLKKAIEIYAWADSVLVRDGRVADGIHDGGPEWNDHLYNQATYIGASKLLYQLTKDKIYSQKTTEGLNYISRHMAPDGILPREFGPEQGIYTAIFSQYALPERGGIGIYDVSSSLQHYRNVTYEDVYHASGLPAMLLYRIR